MIVPKKLLSNTGPMRYQVRFNSVKPPVPSIPIQLCLVDHEENGILYQLFYDDTKEVYEMNGPDIQIKGIYLTAGENTWDLNEVTITREDIVAKFPYYGMFGMRSKDPAIYIPISDKPDIDMKPIYDAEYLLLKERVLQYTVELTLGGSLFTAFLSTMEKGYAFGIGGCIGYIYMNLLEFSVDRVGKNSLGATEQMLRLGTILWIAISLLDKYHADITQDKTYFLIGWVGFMMHRIALIISYLK